VLNESKSGAGFARKDHRITSIFMQANTNYSTMPGQYWFGVPSLSPDL
jgi:hypothetical protein